MKVITNRNFGRETEPEPQIERKKTTFPKIPWTPILIVAGLVVVGFLMFKKEKAPEIGAVIYTYEKIPIYYNGDTIENTHGNHFAKDGYYYGQKWQCVEFVKRYLYDRYQHKFPNPYGNAAHFFKPELRPGQLNVDRDMFQFPNGGVDSPKAGDMLVYNDNDLGHVAIITAVGKRSIDIVQQNIYEKPSEKLEMEVKNGHFTIKGERVPAGWLRLPRFR